MMGERTMRQQSFASEDFEKYRKKTRKEIFLEELDQNIPWASLSKVIEPYYPKPEGCRQETDWHRTHATHPFPPARV